MQIFFDFELDNNIQQPKDPNNLVYQKMRKFVKERYSVLEDKIDLYQKEDEFAMAVICLEIEGIRIITNNIPPELKDKFESCISEDDIDYILTSISNSIDNENKMM